MPFLRCINEGKLSGANWKSYFSGANFGTLEFGKKGFRVLGCTLFVGKDGCYHKEPHWQKDTLPCAL
jgi:hypothetical protein